MVGIFTGSGAGAERGSASVLGGSGLLGSGTLGRSNERVLLNAATGNLMIQQQDEMLVGRGNDVMVGRTYNSLGDLSDENGDNWRQSTDRRVYGLTGTANTSGSTIKRMSADGSVITYTWTASASAYVAKDGAGAYDTLIWASGTSTWTWTDGESGASESYAYAASGGRYLITKATDIHSNALTFSYLSGGAGKLDKVTTADGGYTQYAWSGNNITQIVTGYTDLATSTAKTLTRTRYGYDGSNRLTTVTVDLTPENNSISDGKTYVTTYTYAGTSKRVASITQTDGSSLAITYDGSNRVSTMVQTSATGVTRTTTLSYQSGYTTITDPTSQVTRLDYDANGQLTKITAPPATSGAAAQVTQFAYNASGDLTTVTDALTNTTSYSNFTTNGDALTITDRLGNVTTRTFGAKNELLTETSTGSDQSGAAVLHTARWVYDSNRRVRFEISADGNVVEHRYDDLNGGVESATLTYTGAAYDLSALTATQSPTLAQMTSWAAAADQTAVSKRSYSYDARGNITASYGYGTLDSAGNGTAQGGVFYTYDQAGQLLSTNGYQHAAETYVYDGLGRVVSSVDLAGGTTSVVFNDASSSTVVTLAGGLVQTSTYNKAGELISFAESGANTTTGTASYKYDALGRMRMATDATGHKSYMVYDRAGRKVADVDHYGMLTEYRYDANDRVVATVTYFNTVTSAQLTTLADPLSTIELSTLRPASNAKDLWAWKVYDKEGRVIQAIDGAGGTAKYEYDASGRLVATTGYFNKLSASQITGFKTTPPATLTLPTANATRDQVSRIFYDKSGREIGMLDGEGYLTRIDFDAAGRKVAETAYANATVLANRASGSFATLTTGLANAAADRTTRYVYDGQGLLVFTIDASNHVTEDVYPAADAADVNGLSRQTIRYAGSIAAPGSWTVSGVRTALTTAGLGAHADNRIDGSVYDNRDRLTYAIDATGAVTGYKYDSSGNVTKVTRFATRRATATLPDTATLDSWATANVSAANDRIVRNYYNARNELRYSVDGEGYVTRIDYDAEGREIGTTGWFNAIAVTDSTTIAQVATAATGATITTSTSYDMDGRIATTVDGTGTTTSYVYDAMGGMLGKVTRANGTADQVLTQYTHDGAGRVLTQVEASGATEAATTSFTYDGLSNMLTRTDPNGNAASMTYDRAGRVLTSTDQEGLVTSYQYNAFGDRVATTDPRSTTSFRYYDVLGRVSLTRDADGWVRATGYNVFGEVASVTRYANKASNAASATTPPAVSADAVRDATISYSYDKAGRRAITTDAELASMTQSYNAFGEVSTGIDPLDSRTIQTSSTYDRRGLLKTRIVDAAAGGKALTTTYGYDAFGRELTLTDPKNGTTTRTYDNNGRLATSKDALNNTTTYTYDKRGNLAAVTDALGAVTRYAYDKLDRRVFAVDALGHATRTTFDKNGNATQVTAYATPISLTGLAVAATVSAIASRVSADVSEDQTVRSVYDKDDRLRFSVDATGQLTETVYDGAGNAIRTIAYARAVTSPVFTIAGMLAEVAELTPAQLATSSITRNVYDASGDRSFTIDALGFVTGYTYDARGNVVAERRFATAYTAAGDPSDATVAGWATSNATAADRISRAIYDREDRLRFDVDAEGYVTQYAYDKASNLAQTVRYADRYPALTGTETPAQVLAIVGATPPATAQVTSFTYDSAGRLASRIADPTGLNLVTTYTSDANGNVVASTDALGQVTRHVFDALNRRIFTVDAEGGVTKTTYDALGRTVAVRQYATAIPKTTLDAYPAAITAGQAQVAVAPTDRVMRMLYDVDGRQVYSIDAEGYVTERRYDVLDNVTTLIRYADKVTVTDSVTRASLAALLPASIPATAIVTEYSYDQSNRLTQQVEDAGTGRLNVTTSYAYDVDGNLVATTDTLGRVTRFVHDKLDRQTWMVDAAGYATEMRYDAFGGARTTLQYANRAIPAATLATLPLEIDAGQVTAGLTGSAQDRITRSFHDREGRLAYAIDGAGYVTETRYDAVGNVAATIGYAAPIAVSDTMSAADIAALLPATVPADAAVTTNVYDRANRLTDTVDPTGAITHYTLDALGQATTTTRAYGTAQATSTARTFDRIGRTTLETQAVGGSAQAATGYGYNVFGDLITTTDPSSYTVQRGYDASGRVLTETGQIDGTIANDLVTTKVYDAFGRVVQVTDPSGNIGTFHYDNLDRLIVQVDPEGYVTQTTYTATGEKRSVTRYANRATNLGDADTKPVVASSAKDATTVFAYDERDQLVATTDAMGFIERYTLDAFGDRIAVTNKLGGTVFNTFDHRGLLVSEVTQIRWIDPAQNLPMGSNITNTYGYNSRGNLTSQVEAFGRPEARTTLYGYDLSDRMTSTTHDTVEVLTNATAGTLSLVTPIEHLAYDLRGNLIESIDATGARTLFYYDGQDRKVAEVNALGTLSTWQYDASGNVSHQRVYGDFVALPATAGGTAPAPVNPANVRETSFAYDRSNRLIGTTVAAAQVGRYTGSNYVVTQGLTTAKAYDGLGNVVRETDGNGGLTFHYFDKLGRQIAKVDPEGYLTTWQRDAEGNVTFERRYANRVTGGFDQATAVATLIANTVPDPVNDRVTAFTYNRNGQRTSETRYSVSGLLDGATGTGLAVGNAVIRYTYNALGEVLSKHEATGETTSYTYDDSGRLIRQQDAAISSLGGLRRTTDFTYDSLNNLIRVREGASPNTSAADISDSSIAPPYPVPLPVTTTTIGIEAIDPGSVITGTAGNDLVFAPSGETGGYNFTVVDGGDGDDLLINESLKGSFEGGLGNDVLDFRGTNQIGAGGAGSDIFIFDSGNLISSSWERDPSEIWAEVTDFADGVDKIAVLNSARSFSDLTLTQVGSDVEITMDDAPRIIVRNVAVANLTAVDFIISRVVDTPLRQPNSLLPDILINNTVAWNGGQSDGTAANDALFEPSGYSGGIHGALAFGRDGDDHIISESYGSMVSGGNGNDLIEVRASRIITIGGSGNDTLVFDISKFQGDSWEFSPDYVWGHVIGFTSGRDRIVIPNLTYADLTITQVGTNVEISMTGAPRIILEGLALSELAESDFLFPGSEQAPPPPILTAPPVLDPVLAAEDRISTFEYGLGGRLLTQTDASGFTRTYAYDAAGRVVRDSYDRERSDGDFLTEARFTNYDALGRTVGEYAGALVGGSWISGDVLTTHYDAYGDAVAKSINGVVQERSRYDVLGRVIKSNANDGVWREYGYDGNGNVTATVASNGFATSEATIGDLLTRGLNGLEDAVATYTTYDKRDLAISTIEAGRFMGPQAAGGMLFQTLAEQQTRNAFGEVTSETDVRGGVTDYRYNTLGQLVERNSAAVSVTDEHGVTTTGHRPTETYHYDLSGRMVGMDDANGRRTHRTLLEGRGYGDEEALVATEYRPDGSTAITEYNVFGDARALIDGLGRRTEQSFDKMGQVIVITHPGDEVSQLSNYYAYDGLGQRIRHRNSVYQVPVAGQSYPYYSAAADGTFYLSPSGPYLVRGDAGGASGTNGGLTMPVSYPAAGPDGGVWTFDGSGAYAILTPVGWVEPEEEPEGPGGEDPGPGDIVYGVEQTDYDLQGRVISTVNFAGDLTTYSYSWNGALTSSLGTFGGWTRTTSTIADRASAFDAVYAATDSSDRYGHVIARTDIGGNSFAYTFTLAGQVATETENGSRVVTSSYFNTGMLSSISESGGDTATYGYDAAGNRVYERLVTSTAAIKQDGRAEYDLLGRVVSYRDVAADSGPDNVSLTWQYDAVGNIRSRTQAYRPMDPTGLAATATTAETVWYGYDAMNRVTISQGSLVGGNIVRGWGVELTYDAAGQRKTATTAAATTTPGYAAPGGTLDGSAHREIYDYSDDGQLIGVDQANAGTNGVFGTATQLSRYTRDALGRVLSETNYDASGTNVLRSRQSIAYDNRDQVLSESNTQVQGTDTFNSYISNWYDATGMLSSTATQSWSTTGTATSNATTSYSYVWRDSALTAQATLTNTDGTTASIYTYGSGGRLAQVQLTGGTRPRTVALTTDLAGQILTRDELSSFATNPHARHYYFDGNEQGTVNNDGTDNTTFAQAVASSTVAPGTGPFRTGQTFGSAYASFDRQHDAVNPSNLVSAQSTYRVREGDTLAGIALEVWGDANLWYLLASANGLAAGETLIPGRTLIVPNKVVNRANTSDTFRPYDPNEALGDVQPNTPTPRPQAAAPSKKKNKCGIFGAILLAVVAIAVTAVTYGALTGPTTSLIGSIAAGAAAGAVGSVVSQGLGVATGIQDQFSWKGVALSAIGGAVGAGVNGSGVLSGIKSGVVKAGVGAIATNAITQGVAVATGLQSKFSWSSVAAAGVGAAVGYSAGRLFGAEALTPFRNENGVMIPGNITPGNYLARLGQSGAALIANAGTRSLLEGTDFGDNITAALPDVIAQTIGDIIQYGVKNDRSRMVAPRTIDDLVPARGAAKARPQLSPASSEVLVALDGVDPKAAEFLAAFPELETILNNPNASVRGDLDFIGSDYESGTDQRSGLPIGPVREVGWALDRSTLATRYLQYEASKLSGYDYSRSDLAFEANYWLVEQLETHAAPVLAQTDLFFGGILAGWAAPLTAPLLAEGGVTAVVGAVTLAADGNRLLGASSPFTGATRLPLDYLAGDRASAALEIAALGGNLLYGGYRGVKAVRPIGVTETAAYNVSTRNMTATERQAVIDYARRSNVWLAESGGTTVQSTAGRLRSQANAAARTERLSAARAGTPYRGQVGHVPDVALTGTAQPPAGWLDMPGRSNSVVGGGLSSRIGQRVDVITVDGRVP